MCDREIEGDKERDIVRVTLSWRERLRAKQM